MKLNKTSRRIPVDQNINNFTPNFGRITPITIDNNSDGNTTKNINILNPKFILLKPYELIIPKFISLNQIQIITQFNNYSIFLTY